MTTTLILFITGMCLNILNNNHFDILNRYGINISHRHFKSILKPVYVITENGNIAITALHKNRNKILFVIFVTILTIIFKDISIQNAIARVIQHTHFPLKATTLIVEYVFYAACIRIGSDFCKWLKK